LNINVKINLNILYYIKDIYSLDIIIFTKIIFILHTDTDIQTAIIVTYIQEFTNKYNDSSLRFRLYVPKNYF